MDKAMGRPALRALSGLLRGLYDEAKKARPTEVSYAQIGLSLGIRDEKELGSWKTKLGSWLQGHTAPSNLAEFLALVEFLESKLDRRPIPQKPWRRAFAEAQAERERRTGGRPPRNPGSRAAAPFRFRHTARDWCPPDLAGRDADLERLSFLLRARSVTPGYLTLVAPPWAGKTAFLAAWVMSHVPEDTDVIAFFVRQGTEAQNSDDFKRTVTRQLAQLAGRKAGHGQDAPTTLASLCEQAAEKSVARGRKLLLVLDGLDEDTGAGGSMGSIASLLPQRLIPGLTVLISMRPYPPLPSDVYSGHPLRKAEQIPAFRPSPEAIVLRDTAFQELKRLFEDSQGPGREALGFLTLATRGGLGYEDLAELISSGNRIEPLPYDLEVQLRSVAGRVLGPEDLAPDTFTLAHTTLHSTARTRLGKRRLADLAARMDTWADDYRANNWPETSPAFLLQHYPELVRSRGDLDRYVDFTLDHRRLLRLADLGRADLAIASLEQVTRTRPTPAVLASAAASRSLLSSGGTHVPPEVLQALASVGDVARTRSLALSAADPASKALRLIEAVPTLLAAEPQPIKDAQRLAREAAEWAERARYQNPAGDRAVGRAEAVVVKVAVALASAGLSQDAARLLRSVDFCRRELAATTAEAASLLLDTEPHFADALLDELLLEAEYQANSPEGHLTFAREIWAAVAKADPARTHVCQQRLGPLSTEVGTSEPEHDSPSPDHADVPRDLHSRADEPNDYDELRDEARRLSERGAGPELRLLVDRFTKRTTAPEAPADWLGHLGERGLLATGTRDPLFTVRAWASAAVGSPQRPGSALRYAEKAAETALRVYGVQVPAARSLVAQAFAQAGDSAQAREWAAPADGRRPLGRIGGWYRRTALVVEAVLEPQTVLASTISGFPGAAAYDAFTVDALGVLADHAAGLPVEARLAVLENSARARLGAQPLMFATLAVLQAALGNPELAYATIAGISDSGARGPALATVASHLAGTPILLDVTAETDDWALMVLCTLARTLCPAPTDHPLVGDILEKVIHKALETDTWYRVLPMLTHVAPEAVDAVLRVVEVVKQDGRWRVPPDTTGSHSARLR
ncbi:hypothetical protein AB0L71_22370 [Streptomyces sp. NPDC052052]|uniref:hypothetical protein n=1 Tax=Streptomyces sp. NPDC052052 TaxID=3154756 RepID=UPI00342E8355